MFFYGFWQPVYLFVLLVSVLFNYVIGQRHSLALSRWLLGFGIAGNLHWIGDYNYAFFFVETVNQVAGDYDFAYRNYWDAYDREELFRDPDHSNETGAEIFSKSVLRDCFNI